MSQEIATPLLDEAHLRVEGLSQDLKRRSTRSGALMVVSYAIQLAIGVAGTAVLARLLSPRDFGYLAMSAAFISLLLTLREFLFTPAVYKQELSHEQASGLFWINCLASVVVAALVAAIAPALAWFFGEPRVMGITLVMSAGVLLNMLSMFHVGLLHRQMQFGAIMAIDIGAITVGVIVGIGAALWGAGYWALVFQQMAVWVWQSVSAWCLCSWRPAPRSRSAFTGDAGVRSMLRYGQNSTASRFLSYISRNVDGVLIGYFAGAPMLGLYQKAYQWAMMPFWQIYIPTSSVAVSSFSRLQNDPQRYRVYVRTTLLGVFALILPATVLLLIEARGVVLLLFGQQWTGAIPLLQILSVGAYFSSFALVMNWLYLSEGRTFEQLRWAAISAPVMIVGVSVGTQWGATGVACGFTIAATALAFPAVWHCLRRSPVSAGDFWIATWRAVAASLAAGSLLWMLGQVIPQPPRTYQQVILHSAMFGLMYPSLWLALPGGRASWAAFQQQLRAGRGTLAAS